MASGKSGKKKRLRILEPEEVGGERRGKHLAGTR